MSDTDSLATRVSRIPIKAELSAVYGNFHRSDTLN